MQWSHGPLVQWSIADVHFQHIEYERVLNIP